MVISCASDFQPGSVVCSPASQGKGLKKTTPIAPNIIARMSVSYSLNVSFSIMRE